MVALEKGRATQRKADRVGTKKKKTTKKISAFLSACENDREALLLKR